MPQPEPKPESIDRAVGRRIEARRKALGLTQRQLGDAIGTTPQQLRKYELGHNRVSVSTLMAIARSLQCPVSVFVPTPVDPDESCPLLPDVSPEARELLALFQQIPADTQRHLVRFVRDVADPA
jgi:transcriptional regulator with XRE-family HTH domain